MVIASEHLAKSVFDYGLMISNRGRFGWIRYLAGVVYLPVRLAGKVGTFEPRRRCKLNHFKEFSA